MISHHHKCIFVHIPKTGGQSIEHIFLNLLDLTWATRAPLLLRHNDNSKLGPPRLAHLTALEYLKHKYISPNLFDEYFKFSFVRNPWSRVVSFYNYKKYYGLYSFKKFAMSFLPRTLWNKEYWFVAPQNEFILSAHGELLVNYIGKFERLQNDFNNVSDALRIPQSLLPHINNSRQTFRYALNNPKTFVQKILKKEAGHKKYTTYFDNETREFIADLYKTDIEYFNYTFDENANK